ncbi:MAG TPA: metalloregulator ArsR/SmtB family transcription factor [Kiritimatiellia bacterium]|nr:metalloregulator ArsR/SmtB family transcription factor [Kiritimatiellia bacterium]
MNHEVYHARAAVMKALANPARLMIVDQLKGGERCICELQPLFRKDKSTLSRHVAALRKAGIVSERREGVRVYLKLVTPCILNIFDCVSRVLEAEARRAVRVTRKGKPR